ncbi:Uncharacterised protein [Serratia entomophila]|uniref:host nuclease inhibitor GamL n=1 Tax=Serratia entomophila TaxID=42906 RepID=UPI002179C8C4|nr:host nuclease inhibitor GamL [Serratia entomophila]CAI1787282.1 Uncharacterised protein [Serratia entomophila]
MNPFMNYDRAEEVRESKVDYQRARDEWVRDKADELSKKWPEQLSMFANPFLRMGLSLQGDDAQEAYAEMVEKVCQQQAEKMAGENEFLHGTFREVA